MTFGQLGIFNTQLDLLRDGVESVQRRVALRCLQLGTSVVLDWGVWSRAERDRLRMAARAVGARVMLCLLDPPIDVLWDRVALRNAEPGLFQISRADLEEWSGWFERPTAAESELYDA